MNLQEIIAKLSGLDATIAAMSAKVDALEAAKAENTDLSAKFAKAQEEAKQNAEKLEAAKAEIATLGAQVKAVEADTTAKLQGFNKTLLALQPTGETNPTPSEGLKAEAGDAGSTPPKTIAQQSVDHILALKAVK